MLRRFLSSLRGPGTVARPVPLVLYTRADCALCDEMKHALRGARLPGPVTLEEVDIAGDPELEERFGRSIPVLEIAGRVAFKGRLDAESLQRKFARIVRELGRGPAPPEAT